MENTIWEIDWRKVGLFVAALGGAVLTAVYLFDFSWGVILILGILGLCLLVHLAAMYGARDHKPSAEDPPKLQAVANTRRAKMIERAAKARAFANANAHKAPARGRSGGKHDCCH